MFLNAVEMQQTLSFTYKKGHVMIHSQHTQK
jgi:hypothetical protein